MWNIKRYEGMGIHWSLFEWNVNTDKLDPKFGGLNIKMFISMCADREETTAKINSGGLAQPVNIIRTCVMFCCAEWMKYICTETVLVSE